ncbi:hypothetical protein K504DRAFT_457928 [Pleomassaria siparia CBS 279.74]|uniref:Uncharacterized protein n=1 Tax=Pleomassaria siparia CBS 279.74 TaxID=1314801 RepID=A0A6G1KTB0_9PLEO|nr:hypothetical protein K504DRAFT_457928 [Pleomassaria siparia CBS 279.74]
MEKIKSMLGGGGGGGSDRQSLDATREEETPVTTNTPAHGGNDNNTTGGTLAESTGQGIHPHQGATRAAGTEEYHPIYDQFKGQHNQLENVGGSTPSSTQQHNTDNTKLRRPDTLNEDASTASIRSGVIGFPGADHDTHASLGHNPIQRQLDNNQGIVGTGSLADRSVAGEQQHDQQHGSHLGRDAALGTAALGIGRGVGGAGGADETGAHHLRHQEGNVGDVSSAGPVQSSSHPLENPTTSERHTDQYTPTTATGHDTHSHSHSHSHPHQGRTGQDAEQISQPRSDTIGEQSESSHLGRDAAVGGTALGAVGLARHNLRDDEASRNDSGHLNVFNSRGPSAGQSDPQLSPHQTTGQSNPPSSHTHTGDSSNPLSSHHHTPGHSDPLSSRDQTTGHSNPLSSHDNITGQRSTPSSQNQITQQDQPLSTDGPTGQSKIGDSVGLKDIEETLGHSDHQPLSKQPAPEKTVDEADFGDEKHHHGGSEQASHKGRDAALGAGAVGASGLAARELSHQHGKEEASRNAEASAPTSATQATSGSDRAFPLTGGVTGGQPTERSSSTHNTSTHDRAPGTKEKEVGLGEDHNYGREALAGAAAAATATSAIPSSHHDREREPTREHNQTGHSLPSETTTGSTPSSSIPVSQDQRGLDPVREHGGHGGLAGPAAAATAASAIPLAHHERERESARGLDQSGHGFSSGTTVGAAPSSSIPVSQHQRGLESTPDRDRSGHGLGTGTVGAATAASTVPLSSIAGHEHDHHGHGHTFAGDPCEHGEGEKSPSGTVFSAGPHATDTANRIDPHLHIPGEFPNSTPADETSEPSFGRDVGVGDGSTSTSGLHDTTRSDPASKHHYGRDAALAGGAGAAGLGALAGAKQHSKENAEMGGQEYPTGSSPYSSKTVDPRVYGKSGPPTSTTGQSLGSTQVQDAPRSTQGRDAAMAAGYEASKHHGGLKDTVLPQTSQRETTQPTSHVQDESKHHYGRDAGLVGAGAAAAGGLYARERGDKSETGPASETLGAHKSNVTNVGDPRVQPDASLQGRQVHATPTYEDPASKTIGPHKSNLANVLDPRVHPDPEKQKSDATTGPFSSDNTTGAAQSDDKHHHGRDAALVGGAGTTGLGAYEAGKAYDSHRNTQPSISMNEQRYDPTSAGAHDPANSSQHHYGRDAAAVGGLGAAGAGAYAASRSHGGSELQPASGQDSRVHYPTAGSSEEPYRGGSQQHGQGAAGTGAYAASQNDPQSSFAKQLSRDEPVSGTRATEQPSQHHYGRDAAAVGGLGAAGAGAYAATRGNDGAHQPQVAQQAHQRYDSTQVPDQNQHQKRDTAALGAAGVAAGAGAGYGLSQHDNDKAERERLKEREKDLEHKRKEEQKALDKQHSKDEKHHDKLVAAEEKHRQKEADKVEKEQDKGEKKHGLFGFLHRDKKDKHPDELSDSGSPRQSREYAPAAAGVGAAGVGAAGAAGAYGAAHEHDTGDRNRLHKDPPTGHPAREAMDGGKHEHVGTDGPIGRRDQISGDHTDEAGVYSAHEPASQSHSVTEPTTGLPMKVEEYGDGHGGTDGSQTIGGYREAPHEASANWDAIKKANTPY